MRGKAIIVFLAVAILAAGLFFFARSAEMTVPLVINFTSLPEHLVVVGRIPVVEVRLKGPVALIKGLEVASLNHQIPLPSVKPGRLHVKIPPDTVHAPQGTSVRDVSPASFFVRIDTCVEKLVPVLPDLNHEAVTGFEVSTVTVSPPRIRLTGPHSVLEKITAVRTTPIDLTGLTETMRKKVALNLNHSPNVRPVDETLIEVTVQVKEKIVEVSLSVHVAAIGTDLKYAISPERIKILLRGPQNTLKTLSAEKNIRVYVDLEGLKPGTYSRHAVIEPPLDTSLVEAEPEIFVVKIFK